MNLDNTMIGSRFFVTCASVCAMCATLALPAHAQSVDVPVIEDEPATEPGAEEEVSVTDYGTVDLAVQDTDLAQILQMLSIQSKKNIITSKSVSATVTANLYDVTLYEALDAILRVNGYGYVEEGNFIYVYTQSELDEMEMAQRTTESRVFELEYLAAADANEFIQPLLSEAGQSSFRGDVQNGFQPTISDGGADSYAFTARLVVNDYPEVIEEVALLLGELDTPPQQVLVEAMILQTTLDEANAFGIDFTVLGNVDFLNFASPLSAVNDLLRPNDQGADVNATRDEGFKPGDNKAMAGSSTVGGTAGPAGLKIGIINDDMAVFMRVLDEVSDTMVLARPKVMVLNRQRAEVLVGARVGYLSTTATETTSTQSVEFLDTGIHLVFRPFISRSGMIRLELAPSVSEASLRTVTDAQGLQVTIPDELTNELTTNVRIEDGQTAVLGGLFRESIRNTRRQVPFLGDIPLIGGAFRGQEDAVDRDEIIFLITPTVVQDDTMWELGDEMMELTDTVRSGARNGLLVFSRERRTDNLNQDAIDAMNAGDTEKALYKVNKSLHLNKRQPEMIKLREELTGVSETKELRSIMDRVLRKLLDRDEHVSADINDDFVAFDDEHELGAETTDEAFVTEADEDFDAETDADSDEELFPVADASAASMTADGAFIASDDFIEDVAQPTGPATETATAREAREFHFQVSKDFNVQADQLSAAFENQAEAYARQWFAENPEPSEDQVENDPALQSQTETLHPQLASLIGVLESPESGTEVATTEVETPAAQFVDHSEAPQGSQTDEAEANPHDGSFSPFASVFDFLDWPVTQGADASEEFINFIETVRDDAH
jgi:type IV pilus assembly protein PilQ